MPLPRILGEMARQRRWRAEGKLMPVAQAATSLQAHINLPWLTGWQPMATGCLRNRARSHRLLAAPLTPAISWGKTSHQTVSPPRRPDRGGWHRGGDGRCF